MRSKRCDMIYHHWHLHYKNYNLSRMQFHHVLKIWTIDQSNSVSPHSSCVSSSKHVEMVHKVYKNRKLNDRDGLQIKMYISRHQNIPQ